ncbi:hypothetical protein [Vibrio sp. 16]|uniref:hypothetical protein n=1 Tax=Vibrio sp. 16 TaxID=391586 RepID=UPI00018F24EE|nr:hypothetical protein [Vibrio sp. 16]EED26752.1 hypothetical protein VPMS16_3594 [Vibrio sp. 16]CAK4070417.1 hypothetical protein VDT1_2443 [Vibrio sp. 16]
MKRRVLCFGATLCVAIGFPAVSQDFLPVKQACDERYTNDLDDLKTTEPSNYDYYHYIASGGCPGVELREGRFERINQHFARLGNFKAQWELTPDYTILVEKAAAGSIPARAKIVSANTVPQTAHYSRDKGLDDLQLSDEIKQRYISQILELAEKGDIRVLQTALAYYLWTPISLSGDDDDALVAAERLKKAHRLIELYGDDYLWLEVLYNNWLLEAKNISWCAENIKGRQYSSEFEKGLYSFSRPLFCSSVFNKKLFNKIEQMSDVSRLHFFKEQIASLEFDFSGNPQARLDQLKKWDRTLNKLALLAHFDVPLVNETLAFSLMLLPYEPNRDLAGFYWLDTEHHPSPLMRLISSIFGKNGYDVEKSVDEQIIPEILASEKYFGLAYTYLGRDDEYYQFTLNKVLPKGDWSSLYTFYLMYKYEDNTRAWAMIKALEQYDEYIAKQVEEDFFLGGLSEPDKKAVEKVMEEIRPYLPEQSKEHFSKVSWQENIQPYLLRQLSLLIEQEENKSSLKD